jgi:hypothetical protein
MPAPDRHHAQIQREIERLTRDLLRHQRGPHRGSPAVLRAYRLLLERAYRRLDELERSAGTG